MEQYVLELILRFYNHLEFSLEPQESQACLVIQAFRSAVIEVILFVIILGKIKIKCLGEDGFPGYAGWIQFFISIFAFDFMYKFEGEAGRPGEPGEIGWPGMYV